MHERRKYERFTLGFPGKIIAIDSGDREVLDVLTSDVSAGGAFVHSPKPKETGARVRLSLIVASKKLIELTDAQGLLRAEGTVLRSNAEGMAVYFNEEPEVLPIMVS